MIESITVFAQIPGVSGAAETSPSPGGVVVVGFLFVVVVLALLAAVTSAMGAWFSKMAAADAAKAAKAAQSTAEANSKSSPPASVNAQGAAASEGDDPALMAVVAAAVHTVIGDRPHRVVSVRSSGPGWAQEGRRQIFSSHRVR